MRITLLGTGTSQGVPIIACDCPVCQSADPRDSRLRSSALISDGETNLVIDAGPDFRQQMLREKIHHLDAILLTHEHNDHAVGLDDIRPFNHRSGGQPIRVFALPRVAADVRRRFEYVFAEHNPFLPQIELHEISENSVLTIGKIQIQAIGVEHGRLPILGFRFGQLTYLTDVKTISPAELDKVRSSKYLIVNALHHNTHPTHMNLEEALTFAETIAAEQTWFTHMSHRMGLAAEVEPTLPPNVHLAFDGMKIDF